MNLPVAKRADVKGKTVFLRLDLDVPMISQKSKVKSQKYKIEDDARLKAGLETLNFLLGNKTKVIIGGHLGRPRPEYQISSIRQAQDKNIKFQMSRENKQFSLEPVAKWLADRFKVYDLRFKKLGEFAGWEIGTRLFLLENLRFYRGEEENDPDFAKKLAGLADIYVNDAFSVCHRVHASIVGVPKLLPCFAGFHLEEEVSRLDSVIKNPQRPLAVVIGGKKIETKLPLVIKMYGLADYVLVGGKIAEESKTFIRLEHQKSKANALLLVADLNPEGTGILENSIVNFIEVIDRAKTVVWNGTMGKISQKSKVKSQKLDEDDLNHASRRIAEAVIKGSAYSVVGGGDTTEFLRKIGLIDKFNFVSTGGGAMLSFLSGEKLPGLAALVK
ncbi:phosphoglycerate kinase [Patescibacteria group bacterium]|nr:phosphoglycerate kinase [Patescibacteria group bacterium]MCL5010487.1 phosphoglycerate kinase [Patescibacteria group bacterium]